MKLLTKLEQPWLKSSAVIILLSLVATVMGSLYLTAQHSIYETIYFYVAFFANCMQYMFIIGMFCIYLPCKFLPKVVSLPLTFLICAVFFILLLTDIRVLELYHFHLNLAMLDLFLNTGGEVISFGVKDWLKIIGLALLMCVLAIVCIVIAMRYCSRKAFVKYSLYTTIVCLIAVNVIFALDYGLQRNQIIDVADNIPLYTPLTMNSLLLRLGVISQNSLTKVKIKTKNTSFYYPQQPMNCTAPKPAYNIIYVFIDSLRRDIVTQKITRHLNKLAHDNLYLKTYNDNVNSTRPGVFTAMYGIPAIYWQQALFSNTPPVMIEQLQKAGYAIQAFASANLYKPEFNRTVFATVANLRITSQGESAGARDNDALQAFTTFATEQQQAKMPFFAFLFLDQVHAGSLDEEDQQYFSELPYPVTFTEMEYVNLSATTDHTPYYELYANVAYLVDKKIGALVAKLKAQGLWDNSIVVFSADHGQEFNENGLNYWGHNSSFDQYQLGVPLIIHWPQKQPQVIDTLATSFDLSATILHDLLQCSNDYQDYSLGTSLFALPNDRQYFLAGSYLENAIISQDQIAIIKAMGHLSFKDPNYHPLPPNKIQRNFIMPAMQELGFFTAPKQTDKK